MTDAIGMAAHNILCKYSETSSKIGGFGALGGGGIYTGHHLIADHCFYISGGLRGMGDLGNLLIVPGYKMADAPVVVVTADANGGKSREHGMVHQYFDPAEDSFKKSKQWTYGEAKAAAVESVFSALALAKTVVTAFLDDYFVTELGIDDSTLLRAGEYTVFPGFTPRKSPRASGKGSARFSPY